MWAAETSDSPTLLLDISTVTISNPARFTGPWPDDIEQLHYQSHDKVSVSLNYLGLLGCLSEAGGFEHRLARQTSDLTEQQVINGFLNSPEYHDRFLPSLGQTATLVGVSDVHDGGLA